LPPLPCQKVLCFMFLHVIIERGFGG
jgi:hypothetical protein